MALKHSVCHLSCCRMNQASRHGTVLAFPSSSIPKPFFFTSWGFWRILTNIIELVLLCPGERLESKYSCCIQYIFTRLSIDHSIYLSAACLNTAVARCRAPARAAPAVARHRPCPCSPRPRPPLPRPPPFPPACHVSQQMPAYKRPPSSTEVRWCGWLGLSKFYPSMLSYDVSTCDNIKQELI